MRNTGYVVIPNWIESDRTMYDSTKYILCALLSRACGRSSVRVSQRELAEDTGYCANTVRQALQHLQDRGIVFVTRSYYYSHALQRVVRAKNRYHLRRVQMPGGYTLLPRCVLTQQLTGTEFAAALHLYRLSGRKGRCFPSLRGFAKRIDHGKASVCRAIRSLHMRQLVTHVQCKKRNHAYTCNSYYPVDWVRRREAQLSDGMGGLKFEHLLGTKEDNEGFYRQGEEIGVGEFGEINKNPLDWLYKSPFWFDGTGVRIFAWDAPDDLVG